MTAPAALREARQLFRSHPLLVVLCVAVAGAEAVAIQASGSAAVQLAPQVTAPAPFGLFHDLRWLVVYHRSTPEFGFELGAAIVFRSVLDAVIVRAAWPLGLARPSFRRALLRTATFTLVAVVLLAPWVTLLFGLGVVSLSWLFFAAVPPVLVIAMLTHSGAVRARWWLRTVPLRSTGWAALTFLVMTACAAVVSAQRGWLTIPVAMAGGLFNAWAWRGVVGAATRPGRSERFAPVAPLGLAGMLVVAVAGTTIGFSLAKASADRAARAAEAAVAPHSGLPVMIVAGFGTHWDGHAGPWLAGPYDETRFSYAGLAPDGQPRPYKAADTEASLGQLQAELSGQVDAFAHRVRRPVTLIAASEGSLVAEVYLAVHADAPVDQVVLVSPLIGPGAVYYPSGTAGFGVVGRDALQALTDALGSLSPLQVSPSTPLFRSMVDNGPALGALLSCPLPGVRQVAVLPLADAVAAPAIHGIAVATVVVPAFHSGSLGDPSIDKAVTDVLSRHVVPPSGVFAFLDRVVRSAASAWQVPSLQVSANPAWVLPREDTQAATCARIRELFSTSADGARRPA